jgi:hypothetical protein
MNTCAYTMRVLLLLHLMPCRYSAPPHVDARKRQNSDGRDFFASDRDRANATRTSRLSTRVQELSSSSSSDSDDVFDLTLSRRVSLCFQHLQRPTCCNRPFSYHAPRKNRAHTAVFPPKRQSSLNFATSKGGNSAARLGAAAPRSSTVPLAPVSQAAAASSREPISSQRKLTFCELADVRPTRIFAENNVRSWSSARVTAWQNRLQDIHTYMMHLPFPHEAAATILHQSQQWSVCESDRLLAIIDKCIQYKLYHCSWCCLLA